MIRDPRLPRRLVDVVPPEQVAPILAEKVRRTGARVTQTITDVVAEVADQRRQQAGAAAREARRARLADAGVLKTPPGR